MSVFEPPPTWADPVIVDEATGKSRFNPVWLKWFIDFTAVISAAGGGGGGIVHNDTSGLQGGTSGQYYHLTSALLSELTGGIGSGNVVLGTALTSWTPTDASGAGLSLTLGTCQYLIYGRLCFAGFNLTYPVTADASACKIGGLPATAVSGDSLWPVIISFSTVGAAFTARVLSGTTTFEFDTIAGSVAYTNVALSGKNIRGAALFAT